MKRTKLLRFMSAMAAAILVVTGTSLMHAQGVTTGSIAGVVADAQGAVIPGATVTAVHEPSGTSYEGVTQADGRFVLPGLRVGGPYKVSAILTGFGTEVHSGVTVTLGVTTDLDFKLKVAAISEEVTVTARFDPVFSTSHTGAATAVMREDLAALPTISGRINDIARLSPQYGASGSFSGQDSRMNNITVDGAYFNNSFGLRNTPGDTSGVAPISLEAIEQVQVSVAPYDVRQGNFVGAGVNTVTRSGANAFTGSAYHRFRNESFVGKEAAGQTFNPGTFDTTNTGEWVGGPIVKNKLFFFESFESQNDTRPLNTFTSNPGGVAATGNTTRVLASDLNALSTFLSAKFSYTTGPFDNIPKNTPGKPFLIKGDYNINNTNKVSFRYNQLNSSTDQNMSGSNSLGNPSGRPTFGPNFLNFQGSNYTILENIKSGIGEWNSVINSSLTNNFLAGYTHQDESRGDLATLFPFVDIMDGNGVSYTAFGSEPFTPFNKLLYNTFQAQDSMTKFNKNHSLTFGGAVEKYHSDNSFYPGVQSAYTFNSLPDFYTAANAYLANPNATVSPVPLRFQVSYSNVPGQITPPFQQLDVWYTSAYGQDEWRPKTNLTVTAGVRVDVAKFGATGFDNPAVDALTFRDQNGSPIQYNTGALPKASPLWSPRVGFNWDVQSDGQMQLRGGTGVFTGKPAYVWISNQIGNTGMLTGSITATPTTAFPFNPNPDKYKPAATGLPPVSATINVTDQNFKFPQTWRTNLAVDRRLPGGLVGTVEYIYNRDVNGMAYINANLPAAQSAFTGVDNRPRWTGTVCAGLGQVGPCVNRINNAIGDAIAAEYALQNQSVGRSWNIAASVSKPITHGFAFKGAYSYGEAKNTIDPGSIASGSWTSNAIVSDPNNPVLAFGSNSPGHRVFFATSYTQQYAHFGATTVAAFFDAHPNVVGAAFSTNNSYLYSADMNGDGAANDLIYIPRNASEMNFQTFAAGGKTFTAADQTTAFEAYIQQDDYLKSHRGQYAERNAVFNPIVKRLDLSVMQDVFHSIGGRRHSGQIRLDVTNFGNLLNHSWGAGQAIIQSRILSPQGVDATGAPLYRLATVTTAAGTALVTNTFQTTAGISDVYVMMLSFRYTFN
jgi:hypothetical protein